MRTMYSLLVNFLASDLESALGAAREVEVGTDSAATALIAAVDNIVSSGFLSMGALRQYTVVVM
jgi:hypothetical protein